MKILSPLQRAKHYDRYLARGVLVWCTISAGLAASSCRMGGDDDAASATMQEVKLVGRYNLEAADPSNTVYKQLWFSRDGTYEGLRRECVPGECLEKGEFIQRPNAVTLTGPKGVTTLDVRATAAVSVAESGMRRGEARALGAVRPTASDAPAPSEDCDWSSTEASEDPGAGQVRTASMGPTSADEGLLAGGTSCLLAPGGVPADVIKKWQGSAPDGETFTAQLVGTQQISKSTPAEPRGKGQCSFMNFCRSYTCYVCSTSDTGGCKPARNDNCDYLCPSHRESRCVGPLTGLLLERCGQADGCQ